MEGEGFQIGSMEMREDAGAMEKTCSKVKGAMEEKMGAMEKKMGAMEEEFVQQQMGAMEEKNCTMEEEFVQQQMIAGIGEMEYVRVHKLDDVPFVDPDEETQDPFAMTE